MRTPAHLHACAHTEGTERAQTHTHTHTRARANSHSRTHARTHTRTHAHAYTHTRTRTRTHAHARTHALMAGRRKATLKGPIGQGMLKRSQECADAHCSGQGRCIFDSTCECYAGYSGNACSSVRSKVAKKDAWPRPTRLRGSMFGLHTPQSVPPCHCASPTNSLNISSIFVSNIIIFYIYIYICFTGRTLDSSGTSSTRIKLIGDRFYFPWFPLSNQ